MSEMMPALHLKDKTLTLCDAPIPEAKEGEALIRVLMAGVCNTDIELSRGYMNFNGILGHEFVGVVEKSPSEHWIGKRVVGEINCVCHKCKYCQMEIPNHCADRSVLGILNRNGTFAKYITLPEENLHEVPADLPDEVAVFCEPVAAAYRITEQIQINTEDRIIVLGDGKLGQLIAQVLKLYSKNICCVGRHPKKLELLKNLDIETATSDELPEHGADIVVDATGSPEGLSIAQSLVRPEGTVILKSTVAGNTTSNMSLPVINEIHIIGSRCGPFRPALEALAIGNVEVRPMITARYPLSEAVEALKKAAEKDSMKILIEMD